MWDKFTQALLRARGGISECERKKNVRQPSSPRTRRYFHGSDGGVFIHILFSAHAEVFPPRLRLFLSLWALLRARGGISMSQAKRMRLASSSPRTRRYFHGCCTGTIFFRLFSAHAEVFPIFVSGDRPGVSLLRARGGISDGHNSSVSTQKLFSAHAEVFPKKPV